MKKTLMSLFVAGLLPGTVIGLDETSQLDQARQTVAAFAGTLKSELMVSMQSGGAVKAIEVCNTRAPVIAEEISIAHDTQVSRVSQRYRNPGQSRPGRQPSRPYPAKSGHPIHQNLPVLQPSPSACQPWE